MKTNSGLTLILIILSILVAGAFNSASAGEDDFAPAQVALEESLVWRTRVAPQARRDWFPTGFHYGVSKPYAFGIDQTCSLPFEKQWELPQVKEGAQLGWAADGPIRLEGQPLDPNQTSDAPQFGVKVASDHVGLRLTHPTFLLPAETLEAKLGTQAAQMPDSVEFRVELGSQGAAEFSIHNDDPNHIVTFHNLRYTINSEEIPLSDWILLDQTVPLAHAFADERQVKNPPVVRSKVEFATFRENFPDLVLPLIVASDLDSRKVILGELQPGTWVYVEGFATRTDREGRPILDAQGLPERPSEFRYGFRVARHQPVNLDLARFTNPDEDVLSASSEGRRGMFAGSPSLDTANTSAFGFPFLGGGGRGFGGGGYGGSPHSPIYGGGTSVPLDPIFWVDPHLPPGFLPGGSGQPQPSNPSGPTDPTPPGPGPTPTPAVSTPEPASIVGALLGVLALGYSARRYGSRS